MINKSKSLTPESLAIVKDKGTEVPHLGVHANFAADGTYLCRQCGLALFRSDHKFLSSCGWPSFDNELENAIKRQPDQDGRRTEILCQRCDAHLGHVFTGEGFTEKNLRHCVNSLAIDFVDDLEMNDSEEAIFAGGCFWGMQQLFREIQGVVKTEVGYIGGQSLSPTYRQICSGNTGHFEAVRVIYDPTKTDYEALLKVFFEIHDPTQFDGQGVDIGDQYKSVIFYFNELQKAAAEKLILLLKNKGLNIATQLLPVTTFWLAEESHQDYYQKHSSAFVCHRRIKRF